MTSSRPWNCRIKVLRITPAIGETSAPYNQFCLPLSGRLSITLCTYFKPSISVPEEIKVFAGDGSLAGFFRALRAAFDIGEYDIVHAHLPNVSFLSLASPIFTHWRILRSTVHTVHSSYQNYKLKNRLMLLPVFACFRRLVFCSRSSLDSFPLFWRWLAGNRAVVIQNGVDLDRIDRVIGNASRRLQNETFKIVVIGRLISIKKPTAVLHAFHQLGSQASELVFIGDGNLRESLISESRNLGLQNQVKMTGLVQREEVYKHLAEADLFVSMSTVEGLPVAVLEAMACRCPVILSDIPPHREIAADAEFIPLIRPDDVGELVREIRRFKQMPSLKRAETGEKCRKLVEERFSLSVMLEQYEKLYTQLLVGAKQG